MDVWFTTVKKAEDLQQDYTFAAAAVAAAVDARATIVSFYVRNKCEYLSYLPYVPSIRHTCCMANAGGMHSRWNFEGTPTASLRRRTCCRSIPLLRLLRPELHFFLI